MDDPVTANDPRAWRMAGIAFVTHNLMVGCVFGSYGVLLPSVEEELQLSRDVSSLGIPLVMLVIALGSPVVGGLLGKVSLRLLMMLGALLMIAGFAALSLSSNLVVFLLAYGLLIGPAMALNSTMIPITLVTRWFNVMRGRALGFVNMPLLAALMPPLLALVMTRWGLPETYALMAALGGILALTALFAIDRPPDEARSADAPSDGDSERDVGLSNRELLRSGPFWAIVFAFAAIVSGASVMSAHIAPMAMGWGMDATRAATLLSFSSIGGMAGSAFWGWVSERLGGARVLGILCLCGAILWALLLLRPGYALLAPIAGLMGFSSGAVVPVSSLALSQAFGRVTFSRAYGLCNLINLPSLVLGVPVAALIYVRTGSYAGVMLLMAGLGALGMFSAFVPGRAKAVCA